MRESTRRGRPINPQVKAREQEVYAALETPCTSRGVSEALNLEVPDVRSSLKRLREKGTVTLEKVNGAFLWSRTGSD